MYRKINFPEKLLSHSFLILLCIAMGAPFLLMISMSLASNLTTTTLDFTLVPQEFRFENYLHIFTEYNIGSYLKNSLILVVGNLIGHVFSSSLIAYGFARFRAPGKNFLFLLLLSTLMIPAQVTLIPQFVLFRHLGWLNTFYPLIVPSFFGNAFNIFVIRQFIARIPTSLDDAAKLDGLGPLGIYWRIILPQIMPILVVISIFTFQNVWNWFLEPLIYLTDPTKAPLAVGVRTLSATANAGAAPPWNIVMVASMFLTLPVMLVFVLGQRYMFESDFTGVSSGIK